MVKEALLSPEEEDRMIEQAFADLMDGYLRSNHRKKVEMIERAYRFAKEAHRGVRRRSGEPYIMHPIAVAKIASQEIGLGSTSICAALLHDVVEDTEYTVEDIEQHFGPKIAQLVEGLTKISGGIFGDRASVQAENFRKLLLTMSEDIRVVLVKMADRLHNMRTLGSMAPNKRYKIAGETLYIYAPLAHRLGLFAIKTELEDLSFKHEHPDIYQDISDKIKATQQRRSEVYTDFSAPIKAKLNELGIQYEAKARLKSVYSIYKKMEAKHLPFEEVYDLYAMRIIFECDDQAHEKAICWSIYSAITDLYQLHPSRTRDWIVTPKANGYQALHLTVSPAGVNTTISDEKRLSFSVLRKSMALGSGLSSMSFMVLSHAFSSDSSSPSPILYLQWAANPFSAISSMRRLRICTSTQLPSGGEPVTLPAGATVLDLAFALHTEIGMHCIAAKVNHKLVPLQHELRSGDQAEILTSKNQMPQPEWESFMKTAKGRTRLRQGLRRALQPMVNKGADILSQWLADNSIPDTNMVMTKLQGIFHVPNREELCRQLGAQEIMLGDFLVKPLRKAAQQPKQGSGILSKIWNLGKKTGPAPAPAPAQTPPKINPKQTYRLSSSTDSANFKLAPCCSPIPGDDVMGFIDDDGMVEIHSLDCPRAQVLKAAYGSRIIATEWDHTDERFLARVHIEGIDRLGILQELTNLISNTMGIDMRKLNIEASGEVFACDLWVRVRDVAVVDDLCARTKSIDGVRAATRIH